MRQTSKDSELKPEPQSDVGEEDVVETRRLFEEKRDRGGRKMLSQLLQQPSALLLPVPERAVSLLSALMAGWRPGPDGTTGHFLKQICIPVMFACIH